MASKVFNGKRYDLYDGFPTKAGATSAVRDLRAAGDLARVVDGGKGSGRLRYLVYNRMKR